MALPTLQDFLNDFPEFSDSALYPPSVVQHWLDVASIMLTGRWDDSSAPASNPKKTMLYIGAELFVAHFMTIAARNLKSAALGGGVGQAIGALSAKSVDQVSLSYDVQAIVTPGAGHWNLTTYGMQFRPMAMAVGSGGMQTNTGYCGYLNPMVPVPQGPGWFGPGVDQGWDPD